VYTAILLFPAGTVYVPEELNVCASTYGEEGVTDAEALEPLEEDPYAVVAATVNVYAVPDVSPFTVIGDVVLDPVIPPGDDVAT
jgi:hypothetical protein